jgi:WD40 repeat protein/serine/threonine protein kinase
MSPQEPRPPAAENPGPPSWIAPFKPVVPDHELVARIGGGSYGDVWLARSVVGTWRAVKVVFRDRFLDARPYEREFNGIQKFEPLSRSNEGFVDILQIGRNDAQGYFYYVMELADDAAEPLAGEDGIWKIEDGQSLTLHPQSSIFDPRLYTAKTLAKVLLQRGRLPVSECLELGMTLNLALAHLHNAGLIHRDIKPSNIIFVGGVPKLADIGLVIEYAEARSYVGTEGFIPPEGPNSPQADLYSLGKVLYEAGMGKDRKDFPELFTQLVEAPEAPELLEFNAILLKACAANVKDRYQSAEEMNADLALLQGGGSVRKQRKLAGQLRFVQRAGAAVTALAALIALGWLWQARQTKLVRQLVQEKEHERKSAEDNLYFADIRVAYNDWESGQIAKSLDLLYQHISHGDKPDQRGWEWYYLLSLCHRDERTVNADPEGVRAVGCDPTGRRFASAGRDRTVRVWDAKSGACIAALKGHEAVVTCVAWSPHGTRLASGARDGKLILWDASTFERPFVLDCDRDVETLAWSPDGKRIAAGGGAHLPNGGGGFVTVWDASSGSRLQHLTGNLGVSALAWQPAGNQLVAAEGWPGAIQVWEADSGQLLRTFPAHDHSVSTVAWRPDSRQLASASLDQRIMIWDAETWQPVTTIEPAHYGVVSALAWDEDGRRLFSGGADGLIRIWDARNGAPINVLRGHQAQVTSVAWWPSQGRILSGSLDGTVKIWNPETKQIACTVAAPGEACAWSPDGRQLAVASHQAKRMPGVIQVLDVTTWQTRFTLPCLTNSAPISLAWSLDSRRLAGSYLDPGSLQVWDLATRKEIFFVPKAHEGKEVRTVAWSPDGRLLATAGRDWAVRLWNVETKENVLTFFEHSNVVNSAVWSLDGQCIASRDGDGGILIWDAVTGWVKRKLRCPGSSAGRQYDVGWSPVAEKLAAGSGDGTVMIWDATTGHVLHALKGHTSVVRSVHWSPDGRRLVSASEDRTIRIWDPQSGHELLVLPDPDNRFPNVAWSPTGRMIGVASGAALVYDASIGYQLAPTLAPAATSR